MWKENAPLKASSKNYVRRKLNTKPIFGPAFTECVLKTNKISMSFKLAAKSIRSTDITSLGTHRPTNMNHRWSVRWPVTWVKTPLRISWRHNLLLLQIHRLAHVAHKNSEVSLVKRLKKSRRVKRLRNSHFKKFNCSLTRLIVSVRLEQFWGRIENQIP